MSSEELSVEEQIMMRYFDEIVKITQLNVGSAPTVLWHYTNTASAAKIIESKKMWASDWNYLNDAAEGKLASQVLWEVSSENFSSDPSKIRERLVATCQFAYKNLIPTNYVISLTSDEDSLSQWRDYGDDGDGVALGLNYAKMEKPVRSTAVIQCRYLKYVELRKEARALLTRAEEFADGQEEVRPMTDGDRLLRMATKVLGSPTKDEAYRAENEYRVVVMGEERLDLTGDPSEPEVVGTSHNRIPAMLHPRGAELIPHVEVGIGQALVYVALGPKARADAARRRYAMERLLENQHIELADPIRFSRHRYRG